MQRHMLVLQRRFAADMIPRLSGTLADLQRLRNRQIAQIEARPAANRQAEP